LGHPAPQDPLPDHWPALDRLRGVSLFWIHLQVDLHLELGPSPESERAELSTCSEAEPVSLPLWFHFGNIGGDLLHVAGDFAWGGPAAPAAGDVVRVHEQVLGPKGLFQARQQRLVKPGSSPRR